MPFSLFNIQECCGNSCCSYFHWQTWDCSGNWSSSWLQSETRGTNWEDHIPHSLKPEWLAQSAACGPRWTDQNSFLGFVLLQLAEHTGLSSWVDKDMTPWLRMCSKGLTLPTERLAHLPPAPRRQSRNPWSVLIDKSVFVYLKVLSQDRYSMLTM